MNSTTAELWSDVWAGKIPVVWRGIARLRLGSNDLGEPIYEEREAAVGFADGVPDADVYIRGGVPLGWQDSAHREVLSAAVRALGAAVLAEREACAQVAEDESNEPAPDSDGDGGLVGASPSAVRASIAAAIRARDASNERPAAPAAPAAPPGSRKIEIHFVWAPGMSTEEITRALRVLADRALADAQGPCPE